MIKPPDPGQQSNREDRDSALARIAAEHARLLYRVAYGVLRHPQDAEDAVQDALVKLVRSDRWQAMENERAFLARTVWRTALDRQSARVVGLSDDADAVRLADARPTPEHAAAQNDERALLSELIDELPEELRQTLVLSAIEELSSREIGEVMGVPEGTVRTRLMRARGQLKDKFTERCVAGREVTASRGGGR
ncbi:RNA polymerase sigma-70 factor, ECF subfamily [Bryocella elongata]|uniref:RNA polymerase sigma-70 factor, ECF subfamily n=1 Tax=Bryocella elongata TaxID=863522 RepID=A0A1H5XTE0_9BACT|nr:sigma-70 family RNA polymerase sigma factor [Bryocella elongata]SEG14795.1 RNA polymerase sigma-70 factor, ECF subfamily [Bryocella elongata]